MIDSKENKLSTPILTEKYSNLVNEFKMQLENLSKCKEDSKNKTYNNNTLNTNCNLLNTKDPAQPFSHNTILINNIKVSNDSIIVAFIKTISKFIGDNELEKTLHGLNFSIKKASEFLFIKISEEHLIAEGRSTITLKAVSEILIHLINKYISRNLAQDFNIIKNSIVKLCNDLILISLGSKFKISKFFRNAMRNGMTILLHGYSSTVYQSIVDCKEYGINLNVLVTDCNPEHSGKIMYKALLDQNINCKIIPDLSVGYYMKDIDCVVCGSNALTENGGLINRIGTYTLAICAKNFKKPFYVLSECLKFLKLYPLEQEDIPYNIYNKKETFNSSIDQHQECNLNDDVNISKLNSLENNRNYSNVTGSFCRNNIDIIRECSKVSNEKTDVVEKVIENLICDYTPPEFINLIFTDIGIFTSSAVSDELIQMFYS